jgi:hypothetical protein
VFARQLAGIKSLELQLRLSTNAAIGSKEHTSDVHRLIRPAASMVVGAGAPTYLRSADYWIIPEIFAGPW